MGFIGRLEARTGNDEEIDAEGAKEGAKVAEKDKGFVRDLCGGLGAAVVEAAGVVGEVVR
jgi:hypothetical protein